MPPTTPHQWGPPYQSLPQLFAGVEFLAGDPQELAIAPPIQEDQAYHRPSPTRWVPLTHENPRRWRVHLQPKPRSDQFLLPIRGGTKIN